MLLKAALNGSRARGTHPAIPLTPDELAADAVMCVAAGAGALHIHPRDSDGRESLQLSVVDTAVRAVRAAVSVPVGVSTGAWIEPDPERRAHTVAKWREPDMASVNLSEAGAESVLRALLESGIGVEAGVWTAADAERLAATGLSHRLLRVLVEIVDPVDDPVAGVNEINAALDRLRITAPRLIHSQEAGAWPALTYAVAYGYDTRIGFEDTLVLPDGLPAPSNESLVRQALRSSA